MRGKGDGRGRTAGTGPGGMEGRWGVPTRRLAGEGGWRRWGRGAAIVGRRGEVGSINTAAPIRWGWWKWGSAGDRMGGVGGLDW